jgi:hypothetical protein
MSEITRVGVDLAKNVSCWPTRSCTARCVSIPPSPDSALHIHTVSGVARLQQEQLWCTVLTLLQHSSCTQSLLCCLAQSLLHHICIPRHKPDPTRLERQNGFMFLENVNRRC